MVHCEGYDAIRFMTERLERGGQDRALLPRRIAASGRRARGDASRHQPCRADRRSDHDRPCLGPRGDGADPLGAAARPARSMRETCPQYITLTADDLQGPRTWT